MSQKIKLKRGLKANLPTLDVGELAFCTDTHEIFIGSYTENILITTVTSGDGNVTILKSNVNGNILVNGQEIKVYDDEIIQTLLTGKSDLNHNHQLSDISDIDMSDKTNGYGFIYDSSSQKVKLQPLPSGTGSGATSLDGLTDVDVSTFSPSDGDTLKFIGGIWKPSSFNSIYEDFLGTEIPELVNIKPPEDVPFITIYNKTPSSFSAAWLDNISKGAASKYNVYLDNVLIGSHNSRQDIRGTQNISSLSNLTTYSVKVTSIDAQGNESSGTTVNTKTIGTQALSFAGVSSGYVKLPNITFTDIEVFCLIDEQVNDFLIDARNGSNGYLGRLSTGDSLIGSSWSGVYVDGLPLVGRLPIGVKSSIRVVSSTPITDDVNIFSNSSNGQTMLGKLYTIHIYNQKTLIASYDLTSQFTGTTIIDQSGNNKNATFSGGTWTVG